MQFLLKHQRHFNWVYICDKIQFLEDEIKQLELYIERQVKSRGELVILDRNKVLKVANCIEA